MGKSEQTASFYQPFLKGRPYTISDEISVIGLRTERGLCKTASEVPVSSYSIFESLLAGTANLPKDHLFGGVQAEDCSLQERSPARNSGGPNSTQNTDGSRADIGVRMLGIK
jgi:hypothetical protein